MYEPEQFPGVIHRMIDPKTVVLIFASGKIVCAGAKQEEEIRRSVNNIHSDLEQKKPDGLRIAFLLNDIALRVRHKIKADPTGFEPATYCSASNRTIQAMQRVRKVLQIYA